MNKLQRGFTAIEGLLILIIIGILGGIGWYVWDKHNKPAEPTASTSVQASNKTPAQPDPTADWVTYSSKSGQYTLKYPKTWVVGSNKDCTGADDNLLLLGGDSKSTGVYCADGANAGGEIEVSTSKVMSDLAGGGLPSLKSFDDFHSTDVTVDGVKGTKQTGTSPAAAHPGKSTLYVFVVKDKYLAASYYQAPTSPDVLSDFNTMVTKTLKFSPN